MQIMRDESEAHQLVKTHLERTIDGVDVTILNRNNSDNRLYPATSVENDAELAAKLVDAEPESCLAVRLGGPYEQGNDSDPLLACELCGKSALEVLCAPSLVGGEVIGSVLLRNDRPLGAEERERVEDSVSQASPVLANLRNLAVAENRAATDALTGLPNSRSCRDNLKRMVAHAGRTVSPLSAVMFDLDHFKQVNDRFGHGSGDDVLAGVGEVLNATLRGSDFGGRYGGEEFLVLLPGTDQSGALDLAEKLRVSIEALEFQQPELRVTASFGIATYPLDALEADALVRMADRALYAAKAQGRNRVELIAAGPQTAEPQPQDA
jgi:diguanylate cyclase (GGDEF)-like protein